MAKKKKNEDRGSSVLSISLSPQLLREVNSRVDSGLYTSASEVFREALRMMMHVDRVRENILNDTVRQDPSFAERFASALDLIDFGMELRVNKIKQKNPGLSDAEIKKRLRKISLESETDHEIRPAPERLGRLKRAYESK